MKKYICFFTLVFVSLICLSCNFFTRKYENIEIKNEMEEYYIGDEVSLEVWADDLVLDNDEVNWKSSNEYIASVLEDGRLKLKNEGEVTISVFLKNDTSISNSEVITVKRRTLEAISISGSNVITTGNKATLLIETTPLHASSEVIWISSDEKVATVCEEGIVTGLSFGKVTITALSKENESIFATFDMQVQENIEGFIYPQYLSVTGSYTIVIGYSSVYKVRVYPENAYSGVVWESSDPSVISINENGSATGLKDGKAAIRCISKVDPNIKSNYIHVEVFANDNGGCGYDYKGYEIVIMCASSYMSELDPFDEYYDKPDKKYKQRVWSETEKSYNCKLVVSPYPDYAPWGEARINYIIENAKNNNAYADLSVINSKWLPRLADYAYDVTDYQKFYSGEYDNKEEIESGTYDGKIYIQDQGTALGETKANYGLFYNIQWVNSLSVKDPSQMYLDGEWNYTGFTNWCLSVQALLNSENGEYAIGGHSYNYWIGLTNAAGVKIVDKSKQCLNLMSDESKEASKLINGLVKSGVFDPNETWAENDGGFIEGKTVMTTGELWFCNNESRWKGDMFGENTKYGYVPFPYPDDYEMGKTRTALADNDILIYNKGKEKAYPESISLREIYHVVNTVFKNAAKEQHRDAKFDAYEAVKDKACKLIGNYSSIDCLYWFDYSKSIYDPGKDVLKSNEQEALINAISNVMINGSDYEKELQKVYDEIDKTFE